MLFIFSPKSSLAFFFFKICFLFSPQKVHCLSEILCVSDYGYVLLFSLHSELGNFQPDVKKKIFNRKTPVISTFDIIRVTTY